MVSEFRANGLLKADHDEFHAHGATGEDITGAAIRPPRAASKAQRLADAGIRGCPAVAHPRRQSEVDANAFVCY